jgi:hypothetical protein
MSNTAKSTQHKPGSLSQSFFEQLSESASDHVRKAGITAKNTLLNRATVNPHEGVDQGPISPESYPHKKIEKKKSPEIRLFSYAEHRENIDVKAEIQAVLKEIRQLILILDKEQKGLLNDAAKITVEHMPHHAGVYHLNFLEFVLRTLKDIRKTVSESATWFAAVGGKNKKMGYWGMAKKHGTSFSQNNERTVATQSG